MKLAIIGDPVAHSRSPEIHGGFLREGRIAGSYEAIRVPAGEAARAIAQLQAQGYTGCNVTSPLKEEACTVCERLLPAARYAREVNTILFGREIVGTTTDGVGAAQALRRRLGSLRGREILVLGTGPTARATIAQLADEGVRQWLWGRDVAKVAELGRSFGVLAYTSGPIADAVFSALPPAAQPPAQVLAAASSAALVMDANYGERSTLGALLGREVVDGYEMLVAQARASFEFWLAGT